MRFPKVVFFALVLVTLLSSLSFAGPAPVNDDYDIIENDDITAAALLFNPDPWFSPSQAKTAFITVYATDDDTKDYSGASVVYNLATVAFVNGVQNVYVYEKGLVSGDIAIRFGKSTSSNVTFAETIITINFESGPMDVYLPEVTLTGSVEMHFWVASNGSTYYANVTDGEGSAGAPNILSQKSIDDGHIALVPEPVTIAMLGLGGLFLRRRKSD
jgi:hypothetical protein